MMRIAAIAFLLVSLATAGCGEARKLGKEELKHAAESEAGKVRAGATERVTEEREEHPRPHEGKESRREERR